jgi:hypothetical protein
MIFFVSGDNRPSVSTVEYPGSIGTEIPDMDSRCFLVIPLLSPMVTLGVEIDRFDEMGRGNGLLGRSLTS